VAEKDGSVGPDDDDRVVQGRPAVGPVQLVDADDDNDIPTTGRGPDDRETVCLQVDGLVQEAGIDGGRDVTIISGPQPPDPFRIARNEGLAEGDQSSPGVGGFVDPVDGESERRRPVQDDRWHLDDGHPVHV
jgi:hypothetical protein